mmetsp:Transcript_95125/g.266360  ORF Transcript_95125/g.266360 Transcript_95125/m.266360 type:complete len:234 (+) Transcript_95125:76-777(+)
MTTARDAALGAAACVVVGGVWSLGAVDRGLKGHAFSMMMCWLLLLTATFPASTAHAGKAADGKAMCEDERRSLRFKHGMLASAAFLFGLIGCIFMYVRNRPLPSAFLGVNLAGPLLSIIHALIGAAILAWIVGQTVSGWNNWLSINNGKFRKMLPHRQNGKIIAVLMGANVALGFAVVLAGALAFSALLAVTVGASVAIVYGTQHARAREVCDEAMEPPAEEYVSLPAESSAA